jgi:hypothetical protein
MCFAKFSTERGARWPTITGRRPCRSSSTLITISLTEDSTGDIESSVEAALAHFGSHLTRVEVHLSDESAGRSTGADISFRLEVRPEGRNPKFATDNAATVDEALSGALTKMKHVLDSTFGKLDQRKGGSSMGGVEPR